MKVLIPDLASAAITTDPYVSLPEVSENFQRALSYLIAYDKANGLFRFINTDFTGAMRVTNASPEVSDTNVNQATVPTTGVELVARNNDRVNVTIMNEGDYPLRIFYKGNVSGTVSFRLYPGETLFEDVYTGAIYASAAVSSTVVYVLELVARN